MQPLQNAGYDRAITVFSPDGRLFQVEYAREAVKRGTTSIGIKCSEGIVLAVDKRTTSNLVEATSIEKIFKIDEKRILRDDEFVYNKTVQILKDKDIISSFELELK